MLKFINFIMDQIEEKELENKYNKSARKEINQEKQKILEPETAFGINWLKLELSKYFGIFALTCLTIIRYTASEFF